MEKKWNITPDPGVHQQQQTCAQGRTCVKQEQAQGAAPGHRHAPRSVSNPERGDLFALLPGRRIVTGIRMTNSYTLAASAVKAAARDTGATAEAKHS